MPRIGIVKAGLYYIGFRSTLRYDLTESQVLMLRTLLSRKCGRSEFRALRDEVKWEKSLAYKNRCLNVRSATARRNRKNAAMAKRSIAAVTTITFSLNRAFEGILAKMLTKTLDLTNERILKEYHILQPYSEAPCETIPDGKNH